MNALSAFHHRSGGACVWDGNVQAFLTSAGCAFGLIGMVGWFVQFEKLGAMNYVELTRAALSKRDAKKAIGYESQASPGSDLLRRVPDEQCGAGQRWEAVLSAQRGRTCAERRGRGRR